MTTADPRAVLDTRAVHDGCPQGWAQIMGALKARFHTGDFATGLDLVNRIGASAEQWDHHPDITLTYGDVVVSLVSHDVGGITSRDLRMARLISEHADTMGLASDVAGLSQLDLGLDTSHGEQLGPFYAALLGSSLQDGEPVDASGQVPTVWWQEPDADGLAESDPPQQRWHFDVWVAEDVVQARLEAVLAAGGTLVSEENAPSFWVVADADGNRHCVCTPAGR